MKGWIKMYRAMLEWEHFKEPRVVTVFLAFLLNADKTGKTNIKLDELMSLTGLSHNTVTGAISKLVKSGEITRVKQGQNITTTINKWNGYQANLSTQNLGECDDLSTQNLGEQNGLLTQKMGEQESLLTQNLKGIDPKNGTIIDPKNGSIIYNKNNNKNNNKNCVAETRAREEFIADALNDLRVEQGCMAMRISPDEYRQLVTEVTNDWIFRNLPDEEWNLTHLLAQMRIKHNINNRNNGTTNQFTDNPSDPRTKLDQDAVKAMATLAAQSQRPKVVPF